VSARDLERKRDSIIQHYFKDLFVAVSVAVI